MQTLKVAINPLLVEKIPVSFQTTNMSGVQNIMVVLQKVENIKPKEEHCMLSFILFKKLISL